MGQFLHTIAKEYKKHYGNLSDFTFVMPSKRSCSFLTKELNSLSDEVTIAPRIITISDFVAENIPEVTDSRIDLLFRLYECYCSLPGSFARVTFENFYSWGETILSDFNEIDMQMADAEIIYQNVKDLNSIRTNFFTEEQKAVLREYFGYNPDTINPVENRMWQQFDDLEDADGSPKARKKFLALWMLLYPLYKKFKANLAEAGLTTVGGAYRSAAERIEAGFEPYPGEKIVFVGFNALSESERRIFAALRDMEISLGGEEEPKADFIWDLAPEVFAEDDDPAIRFVNFNKRSENFPMPSWIENKMIGDITLSKPKVEVIAVPSNVMQVKVASAELSQMASEISNEAIADARVAVVLPDENLLLPMLYSLPEEFQNPNLTMGFPLKHTPVISFAALLKRLNGKCRRSGRSLVFFFEDVRDLLAHPYASLIFDHQKINKFIRHYENKKRIVVTGEELLAIGPNADVVFGFDADASPSPEDVFAYLNSVYSLIYDEVGKDAGELLRPEIEQTYIKVYTDALRRLRNCMKDYRLNIGPEGVFMLADRMIAGETVAFEGEPLQGLQVMGVLETRCLDFDRVVILSMNEKIMPRVGRNSTFITNALRNEYGLPPANYQEELFAYYFFRIVARSRQAVLTYDSRTSDNRAPGASRYILQLQYLPGDKDFTRREMKFGIEAPTRNKISIEKTDEMNSLISNKNFSASSLNHYLHCPVQFMYNDVMGIYADREKIESIDAIDFGTIVHETIEHLYIPDESLREKLLKEPIVITRDYLKSLKTAVNARGETRVAEEAKKAILRVHFHVDKDDLDKEQLRGSAVVIYDFVIRYVTNIIDADIKIAPFRLWGCEIKETVPFTLSNGREVKMKMVIDRLDQLGDEGVEKPFRIIDYKTGGVHLEVGDLVEVFGSDYKSNYIFQLSLYAELFLRMIAKDKGFMKGRSLEELQENLQLRIYNVPKLPDIKSVSPPTIGKVVIENFGVFRKIESQSGISFLGLLDDLILKITDPAIPFEAEPNDDLCRYCDYALRCELREARSSTQSTDPQPSSQALNE